MEPLLYKIVRPLIKLFTMLVFRPKYIGRENIPKSGAIVLAGNHTNNFDCIVLISATKRTIHFLGKHTLFDGFKSSIFKGMGVIPVDRTKKKNHEATLAAINVLKKGQVIGIFPESTINRTEDVIMPFRMGAVKMASVAECRIVPFAIMGEYKPFRKGLTLIFGKPMTVDDDLEEANRKLMQEVIKLLERK